MSISLNLPDPDQPFMTLSEFQTAWNKQQRGEDIGRFPDSPNWERKVAAAAKFREHCSQMENREYSESLGTWDSSRADSTAGMRHTNNITPSPSIALLRKWASQRIASERAYASQLEQLAVTLSKVGVIEPTGNPKVDRERRKNAEDFHISMDIVDGKLARGEVTERMARQWRASSTAQYQQTDSTLRAQVTGTPPPKKSRPSPPTSAAPRPRLTNPVQIVVTGTRRVRNSPSGNTIWELTLFGGKKVRTESDSQLGKSIQPMIKGAPPIRMMVEYTSFGTVRSGYEQGRQ